MGIVDEGAAVKMESVFKSLCILLCVSWAFLRCYSECAVVDAQSEIADIYRSCCVSNLIDVLTFETKLLALCNSAACGEDCKGMIYVAIANACERNLVQFATKAINYAQLALSTDDIDALEKTRMYIVIADARRSLIARGMIQCKDSRKYQVEPLLNGLVLALGNLKTVRMLSVQPVNRYEVDSANPHYNNIVCLHQKELENRQRNVRHNKLLMNCVVMCDRVVQTYGLDYIDTQEFVGVVREVVNDASDIDAIIRQIKFLSKNGMDILMGNANSRKPKEKQSGQMNN